MQGPLLTHNPQHLMHAPRPSRTALRTTLALLACLTAPLVTTPAQTTPAPGVAPLAAPSLQTNDPKTILAVRQETLRIGVESETDIVLAKGNLQAKRVAPQSPLILRIISIRPLSDGRFIYRVAFTALEPGSLNLSDFLVTPDDTPVGSTHPYPVTILARMTDPDQTSLQDMPFPGPNAPSHYAAWIAILALLWAVCGAKLFHVPKIVPPPPVAAPPPPPTLAELLRPLVLLAASGDLDIPGKARLERIFLQYWASRLEITTLTPIEKMRAIRKHPEAGHLFRTMDAWIHRPEPVIPEEEINAVLEPYAQIDAPDECQTEAKS